MGYFNSVLTTVFFLYGTTFVAAQDIEATTFTVDTPSGVTYSVNGDVTITFNLVVTEKDSAAGSLSDINLYFADDAEYENANVVSSPAVRASKPPSGSSEPITQNTAITVSGAEATLRPDVAQCSQYTHLCAVITSNDASGSSSDDDDQCLALTAAGAGVIDCTVDSDPTTVPGGSPGSTEETTGGEEQTTGESESGVGSKSLHMVLASLIILVTIASLQF